MCSPQRFAELKERLLEFMAEEIYPNEQTFQKQCRDIGHASNEWHHPPILVDLIVKAKKAGLWNMFLPIDSMEAAGAQGELGYGLTNRQYAEICEILGTCE